jgi:OOP family OmpA-OmpF porin
MDNLARRVQAGLSARQQGAKGRTVEIRNAVVAAALLFAGIGAAQAQSGLYLGASFGPSEYDSSVADGLITSGSVDGSDTGFKFFGGFQVNPNFALEAAYVNLGEARYSGDFFGDPVVGGRVEATGINLSGVLSAPLGPGFSVFGKLGLFLWEAEANDITAGVPFSDRQDGTDLSFGIGASYDVAPNVSVRAEWEFFQPADTDTSLLSIGVVFRF